MFERFRFFPVLIATLVAFLGLKGLDLWTGASVNLQAISTAEASEPSHESPQESAEASHEPDHGTSAETTHGDATSHADTLAGSKDYLSAADVDILTSLEERDAKLKAWEDDLKVQQNMIALAEKKVEAKIAELKELETTLRRLMGEQTEKEEEDLQRLVKVYETMKPKAAAPIMERLDNETRLSIAARMKEVKLAAILASMDKNSAEELTRELIQRSNMPEEFGLVPAAVGEEPASNVPGGPDL